MTKGIWQSIMLGHVYINVYAKFYQTNIQHDSTVMASLILF